MASTPRKAQPEPPEEDREDGPEIGTAESAGKATMVKWILNGLIIILLPLIGFSAYLYFSPKVQPPQAESVSAPAAVQQSVQPPTKPGRVVQLDVLNGCGAKGAAMKFTNFLRANGFDVVEMKNYKSSHVNETMVVDRVGDLRIAKQVATALGIKEKNIIQQINPDYYVDVSVIIGKDYTELGLAK